MDTKFYVIGEVEVPEGEFISTMAMIIIAEEARLTVNKNSGLECGLINYSTVEVMPDGYLYTTMGSIIYNLGSLTIHEGAKLMSQMGSYIVNEEDAVFTLDGEFYCGCIGNGEYDDFWFYNFGTVTGSGEMYLYEAAHNDLPVSDMSALIPMAKEVLDCSTIEVDVVWVPGDINGDFEVDNKDIVTLFRYVSGGKDLNVSVIALDTNGDGTVDNKDIVTLFRFVSGGGVTLSDKPYVPEK